MLQVGMEMWKRNPNYPTFVSAKMVIWISVFVFVFKVDVKMDISEFDLQTRIRIRISEFWADSDVKADNIRIRETVSTASATEIPGFQPRAPAQPRSCSLARAAPFRGFASGFPRASSMDTQSIVGLTFPHSLFSNQSPHKATMLEP
jgi:hypothetical protein